MALHSYSKPKGMNAIGWDQIEFVYIPSDLESRAQRTRKSEKRNLEIFSVQTIASNSSVLSPFVILRIIAALAETSSCEPLQTCSHLDQTRPRRNSRDNIPDEHEARYCPLRLQQSQRCRRRLPLYCFLR